MECARSGAEIDAVDINSRHDAIDDFIAKRSESDREREEMNRIEQEWKRSEERQRQELQAQRREEWARYYAKLSDSHQGLAQYFEEKAEELYGSTRI